MTIKELMRELQIMINEGHGDVDTGNPEFLSGDGGKMDSLDLIIAGLLFVFGSVVGLLTGLAMCNGCV